MGVARTLRRVKQEVQCAGVGKPPALPLDGLAVASQNSPPLLWLGLIEEGGDVVARRAHTRSEEHTSELQSQSNLVCRLLLEKKKTKELDPKPSECGISRTGSRV